MNIPERFSEALWDKLKGFFEGQGENIIRGLIPILPDLIPRSLQELVKEGANDPEGMFAQYCVKLVERYDLPENLKNSLTDFKANPSLIEGVSWLLVGVFYSLLYSVSIIPAMTGQARKQVNFDYTPEIPAIGDLLNIWFKNPVDRDKVIQLAKENGFDESNLNALVESARPLMTANEIRDLFLRELITEDFHDFLLEQYGFTASNIGHIKELYWFIPNPQDLIRFAVREAFSPEIVTKYQLDADFPAEFKNWFAKVGGSEDWAKAYWRSHWELPSIQMGYEMLHRGVIQQTDLDTLMRTLDIMPYWRDKLIEISFNPFTRVDVRRMYKVGVLTEAEVKESYLDIGYNDAKATKMMEFTVANALEEERDLTKSEVLTAYKEDIITESEARNLLSDLDYSTLALNTLLSIANFQKAKKVRELSIAQIKKLYVIEMIGRNDAVSRLGALNFRGEETALLLNEWDFDINTKDRKLTVAQLDKLLSNAIIPIATYKTELSKLGYNENYVNWLASLAAIKKSED